MGRDASMGLKKQEFRSQTAADAMMQAQKWLQENGFKIKNPKISPAVAIWPPPGMQQPGFRLRTDDAWSVTVEYD